MGGSKNYKDNGPQRPDRDLIKQFQLMLEYVHAVWSAHEGPFLDGHVDEAKAQQLIKECDELSSRAMMHCMASNAANSSADFGEASQEIDFHAKSTWLLIRGHRYQVLEDEFFRFVLAPHDEALKSAYGTNAVAVAEGIQAIANSIRAGYSDAAILVGERMEEVHALADKGKCFAGCRN